MPEMLRRIDRLAGAHEFAIACYGHAAVRVLTNAGCSIANLGVHALSSIAGETGATVSHFADKKGRDDEMKRLFGMIFTLAVAVPLLAVCGGNDAECRIYLTSDATGSFSSLHVVDSPAHNNWGPNLVNEPAEYLSEHPHWRVFRFKAGRVLDYKVEYTISGKNRSSQKEGAACDDGAGKKYDIDGGYLFTTNFSFD